MDAVGVSVPRLDAIEKVTGRAIYVGDLKVPGMVYGKVLASPVPHARITRIDTAEAQRYPGVIAVLSAEQLTDIDPYYGSVVRDRPLVAIDKVRYQGEPVAAVAAVDEATAERAVALIRVEYEELPMVTDMALALTPGATAIHQTNLCHEYHHHWGAVEEGFGQSDEVFEDTFTFPMVYHYTMEPHIAIAQWSSQGITVWSSAQHPFLVRADLARMLRLALDGRLRLSVFFVNHAKARCGKVV